MKIGTTFWDGEELVDSLDFGVPMELAREEFRCPKCGFVASIDLFEVLGVDLEGLEDDDPEFPEYNSGPDDNNVFCPKCRDDVRAVFVDPKAEEKK